MSTAHLLQERVAGPVLCRGEDGFAEELSGYNLASPVDPDVVVGAVNEDDVVAAVRFAANHDLPVHLQATGHGAYAPISCGVLIRTHRMDDVHIDPATRTATVGAGVCWGAVLAQASAHGLTAITGSSPGVGAVGLVLGGGLGPLSRTYGFAADWAREFRVVTAGGDVVTADVEQNVELFWALKGGKGGLGVVTRMVVELVPQANVYGGGLFFEADDVSDVLHAWVDWTRDLPQTVTSSVCLVRFPPVVEVPEALRGRSILHLRFVYTGEPGDTVEQRKVAGEEVLQAIRRVAVPVLDTVNDLSTGAIGTVHSDPPHPMAVWEQGTLLDAVDHEFVDTLLSHVGPSEDVPLNAVEIRHLGGAIAVDSPDGSAVGGRSAAYSLVLIGVPDASFFGQVLPDLGRVVSTAVRGWECSETNYNFAGYPATIAEFSRAWPPAVFDRLERARREFDPLQRFAFGPQR